MVQRLAVVTGVSVLAVLAVASSRVVATLLTHASTTPARLLKHLHAEAAFVGVAVTLTGWTEGKKRMDTIIMRARTQCFGFVPYFRGGERQEECISFY